MQFSWFQDMVKNQEEEDSRDQKETHEGGEDRAGSHRYQAGVLPGAAVMIRCSH